MQWCDILSTLCGCCIQKQRLFVGSLGQRKSLEGMPSFRTSGAQIGKKIPSKPCETPRGMFRASWYLRPEEVLILLLLFVDQRRKESGIRQKAARNLRRPTDERSLCQTTQTEHSMKTSLTQTQHLSLFPLVISFNSQPRSATYSSKPIGTASNGRGRTRVASTRRVARS